MGTNGPSSNFDIQNFFKNPPPPGYNQSESSPYPPSSHSHHNFSHTNFPLSNSYGPSSNSYSNLAASYPFVPQTSMYNHYPHPQEQVSLGSSYPAPGFGQPSFASSGPLPLPLSASLSQINSPSPSSPALDSARLMALLTNPSAGLPSSVPYDNQSADPEASRPPSAAVPTIPSAPPVSLATTSTSGRVVRNKIPRGRQLKGELVVYDIDVRLAGEAQPQLEHNTITKYLSDPQVLLGRQIAVNRTYICYALRAKKGIRVLNINTALKYLLRGHSEGRVTDMAFFSESVHLLASASTDGRIFVRRIVEGPGEDSKMQISDQILLAIQFTGDWETVHPRVCWHAHTEDLIVIGLERYVFTIDMRKVRHTAAPDGFSVDQPVTCPVDSLIEGVYCIGKHLKDVTDLSTSQWTRLVSASKDGTVRIWREQNMLPSMSLTPHNGLPVDAVALLCAPHRNDHVVLLTAGPSNRELKFWVPSGGEGWFPQSGSVNWRCTQTLELISSNTREPDAAFFNQVLVFPRACLILLPNARRKALYVVHVDFGPNPSATRMDYLAEFLVMMPILSITATSENAFDGEGVVQLYCVQTEAIQQYSLDLKLCVPSMEIAPAIVENDMKGSLGGATPNLEASSTALEVSAMLRAKSPGPISGVSLSDKIIGGHHTVDPSTSTDIRAVFSSTSMQTKEASTINLVSNIPEVIAPTPHVGGVIMSPRGSPLSKSNVRSSTATNSPREQADYVRVSDKMDKSKSDLDNVGQDGHPLSPERPPNDVMRISEDRDWQVISTSPASSVMSEQHGALGSMHLITPSDLMSMAARSKGDVTGGSAVSSPKRGGMSKEFTKPESRLEDYLEKDDLEVLTVETKEVTNSTDLFPAGTRMEKEASETSQSEAPSDFRDRDHTSTSHGFPCMDILKEEKDVSEQLQFDEVGGTAQGFSDDIEESLPSVPVVDEPNEQLKEVSVKVYESSAMQAIQTRKKKNKNKADANMSSMISIPSISVPSTSTSAFYMPSDQDLGNSLNTLAPPLSAVSAQVFSLQESVNQVISMQREFQKQLGTVLAVPIAKEVKKMEVSLGQRMEKTLKAHMDSIWARIQEDNTKREKLERDHYQQLTSMLTNFLNKDLPGALEKALKRELSSIGSHVTRLVIPSVEKVVSSAVNESFQGFTEKGVAQLEKSLGAKIEALVSRQLQTQFQTSGKQILQDGLRACLEASIIPAFERACQEMFGQVDAAFQKGVLEHRAQAQQQLTASHNAIVTSLQEALSQANSLATFMKVDLADGQRKLLTVIENASSGRMPKPISGGLPEKAMTVDRVEESLDPTKELLRLINEQKLEEAFNKALSLGDVGVISWLCNQVDLAALFKMPTLPLSQRVLLALVHQLGCDLGNDTSKKLAWIKDAAVALNPHDPVLAPHMGPFLEQLYAKLHALASNTSLSSELANSTRLVMYVVHSLLSMCKRV
ncbi:hypothetical protein KP509_06G068900 [Ceratopteris richardii]|uniref:Enhancer of mRNA-decapping protein 4 n=1 Tax=Ceratopteris richardii TaxID=49495 RepID=A0A8T2ULC8_CERRI|nr:hypothetical protein KP509_06G068900 [Ceratopteris richardii]KAH7435543.1 hypothetical protein KP509_06G068900 [Ceratopteris richardii]